MLKDEKKAESDKTEEDKRKALEVEQVRLWTMVNPGWIPKDVFQ